MSADYDTHTYQDPVQPLPARPAKKPLKWVGLLSGSLVVLLILVLVALAAFLPTTPQVKTKNAPAAQHAIETVTQESPSISILTTTESKVSSTALTSTSTGLTTEEVSQTFTTTKTHHQPDPTKTVSTISTTVILSSTTASRTPTKQVESAVVSVTSTTISVSTAMSIATSTDETTLSTRTLTEVVESTHKKYKTAWEAITAVATMQSTAHVTESFDKTIRTTKTQSAGKDKRSVTSDQSIAVHASKSACTSSLSGPETKTRSPGSPSGDSPSTLDIHARAFSEIWTTVTRTSDITRTIRRISHTTTWSTTTASPTTTTTEYHPVSHFSFTTVDHNGKTLLGTNTKQSSTSPTSAPLKLPPSPEVGPVPPSPRSTPTPAGPPPNCRAPNCTRNHLLVGTNWCVTTNECDIKCDDIQANACRGICATSDNTVEEAPRCLYVGGLGLVNAAEGFGCCEMWKCYLCEKEGGGYEWCNDPEKGVKEWPKGAVLEEATVPEERKWP